MRNHIEPNEYAPYYQPYLELVPDGDLVTILSDQMDEMTAFLKGITDSQAGYGRGKWSINEVIGHLIDTERIMAYRLLSIARGERVNLPGFDEEVYVQQAAFTKQSVDELLDHFSIVRHSTIVLLQSLSADDWLRRGTANDYDISVRALAGIIAGHERHHRQIMSERYIQSHAYPNG